MLLGCIGDDFTGSSDLANTLAKGGMRTVQYTGVPKDAAAADVQAGVVALKSRSIPAADAVAQSLEALEWLLAQGCQQIFFKYCSTFDSTPEGNNDVLLSESGMQTHPLTPMTDPDIRRCLQAQTQYTVGHVAGPAVFQGASQIATELDRQHDKGHRHIVVDAMQDADLIEIGKAAKGLPLITGGSGVALGLPANFGCVAGSVDWAGQAGTAVALSGSCSIATRAQVAYHAARHPVREIDVAAVIQGTQSPTELADWLLQTDGLPLLYSSADPEVVKQVQAKFGRDASAHALENCFAQVAAACVAGGASQVITAGGETSGAVVSGLGLTTLQIGPEIDPGVPALRAGDDLVIALKSGNFGTEDFFEKANAVLAGDA